MCFSCPRLPHIPKQEELEGIFTKSVCDSMNWASEKATFPLFIQLVDFPTYRYRILLGVTYSAGGISANLVSMNIVGIIIKVYVQAKFI